MSLAHKLRKLKLVNFVSKIGYTNSVSGALVNHTKNKVNVDKDIFLHF
jgi:hypothetical protein